MGVDILSLVTIAHTTFNVGIIALAICIPFTLLVFTKMFLRSIALDILYVRQSYLLNKVDIKKRELQLDLNKQQGEMLISENRKLLQAGVSQAWQNGKYNMLIDN